MRRAFAALAVAAVLPLSGCAIEDSRPELLGSTLERTVGDPDGNGKLSRRPGEPMVDRTELAPKGRAGREVARFAQLTDTHVRDEESPARVPFLDRLGPPVTSTFRPQEAVSTQVLTAMVRTINEERPRQVLLTGDLVDNAQRNELTMLLQVLAGGEVDPDSGRLGYRGVQLATNPDGYYYRPSVDAPRHRGLVGRAQKRFFSPGLRVPWYPALGNHDLLVQGELPPSPTTDRIATGGRALFTFDPRLRDLLDELPADGAGATPDLRGVPPEAIERVLAAGLPGRRTTVPPDPRRASLSPAALIGRLRKAGTPVAAGADRLDYAVDLGPSLRAVVLDTVNRAGKQAGVVTARELAVLRRELARAGRGSIVVVTHQGLARSGGLAPQALRMLDRDPRVVAEISGDTHRNQIRPRPTPAGGRWEIHTSSLADWPQQGRMLRLVTGPDGSRALETWMVDHAGTVSAFDLAGFGRELAFLDAQGGRPNGYAGTRADRNARLWLPPLR